MLSHLHQIDAILKTAIDQKASDIHLKSSNLPIFRLNGELVRHGAVPINEEAIEEFVVKTVPEHLLKHWKESKQVDYSYCIDLEGSGRFRINAFYQRGAPSLALRHIKTTIPDFSTLQLPEAPLKRICSYTEGIVLVCGATGMGKSSTVATLLNYINHTQACHIVTLEDPLEFNYQDQHSTFNQREIGIDTPNFHEGMRAALRQDPDIILIGEMRDRLTLETALSAAETGHFVISTLHALNVNKAIQRLFEFFTQETFEKFKRQVAHSLKCVIAQQLVKGLHHPRYPVLEILFLESLSQHVILKGEFEKIYNVIEATRDNGSVTFNDYLHQMVKEGKITTADALQASPNSQALSMKLKGIEITAGDIV